eukprot:Sspe_Gene.11256::Locus_3798_Transcript_1_1_Confidence_1.000_Length_985::g.11256::m.11256/K10949/KDELR; ER lumen protein retaining receptor
MQLLGHTNVFRFIGDMLHLLSVFIILRKMLVMRSCNGLSLKSQFAYALVFSFRYIPSFFLGHASMTLYLIVMKIFFLVTSWYIVFLMRNKNPWKSSYSAKLDSFRMRFLIVPSAVLAILWNNYRGGDTGEWVYSVSHAFSEFLETVAIMPQLMMLQTAIDNGDKWELLTGHYVFTLGMYRLFYVFNWIYRYIYADGALVWVDIVAGSIQTLLYVEFFHTYIKGISQLRGEALPS